MVCSFPPKVALAPEDHKKAYIKPVALKRNKVWQKMKPIGLQLVLRYQRGQLGLGNICLVTFTRKREINSMIRLQVWGFLLLFLVGFGVWGCRIFLMCF